MIVTKRLSVANGIFEPEDVRALSKLVVAVLEDDIEGDAEVHYDYSLEAPYDTSWKGGTSLLDVGGPLETDQISSVRLEGAEENRDRVVVCYISHGTHRHDPFGRRKSEIVISASDQNWIRSTCSRFEEQLSQIEPQAAIGRYKEAAGLTLWLTIIGITVLGSAATLDPILSSATLLVVIFTGVVAYFLAVGLGGLIDDSYPKIEMRTGPPHFHPQTRRRKIVQFVGFSIFLPLAVSIIANYLG